MREVHEDDVATLQSRAAVERDGAKEVTERRVLPQVAKQSDHAEHHEVEDVVAVLHPSIRVA